MLILILFCLGFALLTVVNYIFVGLHSKNHRLLPMVLVVISLYYFYLLTEELVGAPQVFRLLKDFLLVQVFSILFYYIVELMEIKQHAIIHVLVSALDIIMVVLICLQVEEGTSYRKFVLFFLIFVSAHLLVFVVAALIKKSFTRKQRATNVGLLTGFLIPLIGFVITIIWNIKDKYIMAPALFITCFIINYLLRTYKMIDATTVIKDELFSSVGAASILFDEDMFYLDASKSARELFPRMIEGFEANPTNYRKKDVMVEWATHYTDPTELEIEGKYYNCLLQKVFLKGKPAGFIWLLNDVSTQKNETKRAQEDASNKSMYLAKMSHELRSPLHAIIGGSEIILGRHPISEKTSMLVDQVRQAGENLLSIVNSILEYSKMENGVLKLENKPYEFYELISDQAFTTLVNLRGKNVEFTLKSHTPIAKKLSGDEMRIREIVQNLLSNAVKFTESGFINCDVSMEEKEGRAFITLVVSDSGIGMSKEQISTIFTEFVSYASEKAIEGTGLGLSIIKELCVMMGGDIVAESDGQSGTTMTATFYQDFCDLLPDGSRDTRKDKSEFIIDKNLAPISTIEDFNKVVPAYRYPNARVLVVDDMDVNQQIFQEMTRPWGFMIEKAYSGREAVALCKDNEYDLIMLDQMMPIMSGVETMDVIKSGDSKCKEKPVIMITADITDEMKAISKAHGFTDYLEKPIVMAKLKDVIEKNLPNKYRRPYLVTDMLMLGSQIGVTNQVKESYIKECESILQSLPEIFRTDIDLFRTKVHGLKSTSRQLGQNSMGEFSEIMEMAAKSGHTDFINSHLEMYLDDISVVVEKVKQEML